MSFVKYGAMIVAMLAVAASLADSPQKPSPTGLSGSVDDSVVFSVDPGRVLDKNLPTEITLDVGTGPDANGILRISGWCISGKGIDRVEVAVDEVAGRAIYPLPSPLLAKIRPDYKDSMGRFLFVCRSSSPITGESRVTVRVYSKGKLVEKKQQALQSSVVPATDHHPASDSKGE
jgi:hypothetical protein